jgi:hypothetical protein
VGIPFRAVHHVLVEHDEARQHGPSVEIERARSLRNGDLRHLSDRSNPAALDDQRLVLPGGAPVPSMILTFLSATRPVSRRRGIASVSAPGACANAVPYTDSSAKTTVTT